MGDEMVVEWNQPGERTFRADWVLVRGAKGGRMALARVPAELGDPPAVARPYLEWAFTRGHTYQPGDGRATASHAGLLPRTVHVLDPATGAWVSPQLPEPAGKPVAEEVGNG